MPKRRRGLHWLTPKEVETLEDGLHPDGKGLYLQVRGKARSWLFRTRDNWMGLGPTHTVGLTEARDRAQKCRLQVLDGIDPIEARKKARLEAQLAASKEVTFAQCAEGWMATNAITWTPRYAEAVKRKFEMFVYPKLGKLPVQKFDMRGDASSAVDLVHEVLKPIWETKTKTAELVQQYIYGSLNWAIAKHYIAGDNAADLKGPLQFLLPKVKAFYVTKHHDALPWQEAGQFMARLRAATDNTGALQAGSQDRRCQVCSSPHLAEIDAATRAGATLDSRAAQFGINRNTIWHHYRNHVGENLSPPRRPLSAYAIEFLILTAVRKKQTLAAEWKEIDWDDKLWVCPWQKRSGEQGHRMGEQGHKMGKKTKEDYVVPLNDAAMNVLHAMKGWQEANGIESKFVFPGGRGGRSGGRMSDTAVNNFLKDALGRPDLTIHGFRTTFATWSVEHNYEERDSEMALGHVIGGDVRNIYKRNAKRIEPRRLMMQAWADYCDRIEPLPAEVIPFRQAK